jgi:hypothetical protein
MKALSFLLVPATALALTTVLVNASNINLSTSASQAANGPFRDGLYLGTRAARGGEAPHIAFGRWAQSQDRESFSAGYRQAYADTVATDPKN